MASGDYKAKKEANSNENYEQAAKKGKKKNRSEKHENSRLWGYKDNGSFALLFAVTCTQ